MMVEKGGFCRKVIGLSVNFVTLPAPTLDLLCRYQISRLTLNSTIQPSRLLGAIAPQIGRDKLGIEVNGWRRAGFVERLLVSGLILSLNPPLHWIYCANIRFID
ncbi:hypothetical protein [Coleofasciculus sp. E2-BRE-01]|uniref:hypothetical protein n=1 Tax=Coleofasciculus sp. E2-BRE-01 TaxID=3069524 RepID=UPI003301A12D